jgi:hypothetical protein
MKLIDITGKKFGRLTVIKRNGIHKFPSGQTRPIWLCRCECGKEINVLARNLMTNNTTSCGCVALELKTTHDKWGSKVYKTWDNMKSRCTNPKATGFKYWGGRGIKIYDKWLNSFDAFYDYVSKLPHFGEEGRSLDRINNDGDYEPNNLRWATRSEQNFNKRYKVLGE